MLAVRLVAAGASNGVRSAAKARELATEVESGESVRARVQGRSAIGI